MGIVASLVFALWPSDANRAKAFRRCLRAGGLACPKVTEPTSYGTPALNVRGKLMIRLKGERNTGLPKQLGRTGTPLGLDAGRFLSDRALSRSILALMLGEHRRTTAIASKIPVVPNAKFHRIHDNEPSASSKRDRSGRLRGSPVAGSFGRHHGPFRALARPDVACSDTSDSRRVLVRSRWQGRIVAEARDLRRSRRARTRPLCRAPSRHPISVSRRNPRCPCDRCRHDPGLAWR